MTARTLPRPEALLLDFGGVIVETTHRPGWAAELAAEVHGRLRAAGATGVSAHEVRIDIEAGAAADAHWKNAMSRPPSPVEMTHRMFWADFVAADWPEAARAVVTAHATALCELMGELRSERRVRPGTRELLAEAAAGGIRVAVVSNALSGVVHRRFLERNGLSAEIALQVYSDEVGVRKPNPEMIWLPTRTLGTPPERSWYVGDNFDRDVVCARRAGAGAAVLMEAEDTYRGPYAVRATPDAVVADPAALRELLVNSRVVG